MFEGNPFPGLRPFEFDENYLFFGREEQVAQLLQRLGNTRFLAVVGASGSGKSSLVRAGLLPELHGGTMTGTSIAWELAIMRPGGDPLTNLAEALVGSDLFGEQNEENILQTRATLSRSGLGLIETYRQSNIDEGANLLLLVDQFEEIFRFRQSGAKASQEAAHFIQLLLETSRQSNIPVYIILTMRSDFLGDCAEFNGLAEAVNEGEYLIPRLNRKQRTRAIEGPVKVGGADISPRLKQQLLNDIGDDPDQLPILQHALMRMWEHWKTHANPDHHLDLEHYDAIGRMAEALSRHANEVHDELPSDEHRQLCMKLFKAITEKQADGRGIRRPLPLGDIDEITGHQSDKLLEVIDAYRSVGRTFIMPSETVVLHDQIIIDISHESLMRVWDRLKKWVNEEADSARIYTRLWETALLHERGEAGLYRDPDLKIALAWRDQNKPDPQWAGRINNWFDLSMQFLDDSREDFEAEQKAKEEARKRELEQARALAEAEQKKAEIERKSAKRNKVFAVFLFALATLAVILAFQANKAKKRAVVSEKQAVKSEKQAQENLSFSYVYQADRMLRDNQAGKAFALLGQRHKQDPDYSIIAEKTANHLNHHPFMRLSRLVYQNEEDVLLRARKGMVFTDNYSRCFFLHNSRENAYVKSMEVETGKVVYQSAKLNYVDEINTTANGEYSFVTGTNLKNEFVGLVVDGKTGEFVKEYPDEKLVTAISGNADLSRVLVGNQDGELVIYDERTDKMVHREKFEGYKIHQIKVSPENSQAVVLALKDESYYDVFQINLDTFEQKKLYSSPPDQIRWEAWLQYSPQGKYIVQVGGNFALGYVNVFRAEDGEKLWTNDTTHHRFVISATVSQDETTIASSSIDTTVRLWDTETGNEVSQPLKHDGGVWWATFSPDQTKIATISDQNDIWIWSAKNGKVLNYPTRQKSAMVSVCFGQSGKKVYTTDIQGTFLEWEINVPTIDPALLTHDGNIQFYDMSEDGKWVVTAGKDRKANIWDMAKLSKYKTISTDNNVGMVVLRKNDKRLFVIEIIGWGESTKWTAYRFPELEKISEGNFLRDTRISEVSPDGRFIVYSHRDNSVGVIDVESNATNKTIHMIEDHDGWVQGFQFSPNSTMFVTLCKDSNLRAYSPKTGGMLFQRKFGGLFRPKCQFSNDGKLFVAYTQIGTDSATPIVFDSKTGKEKFRLKHENGVGEVFFSADDKYMFSGSRDFTAKMWDINDTAKPLHTYNVGDWVWSVLVRPEHPDRLFVMSRSGDIYVYDTEKELYIDGPYRSALGLNFRFGMLKSKPKANYFIALNAPNAVAVWPFATPKIKPDNAARLMDFSGALTGVEMDESMALNVLGNRVKTLENRSGALGGDETTVNWKKWQLNGDVSLYLTEARDAKKYRQFLIDQNTLASLEEVLYRHPMDKGVIGLYAEKLAELAEDAGIEDYKRDRYRVSSKWYKKLAE